MRRTYRSKKDTGGALDHRDVLLNMDEKSSAFDAFYIQNIKQTKRELSCVGSSNAYGVASKKTRKKKYVKRIVKEVENVQPVDSMCTSTYLTPDKSIRVNKLLDPFDMLLNSSSTEQIVTADKQNLALEQHKPKKESKTYTRKKLRRVKKFDYLSEYSSDSDKENTSNPQSNASDIWSHELLVEKVSSNSPNYPDESINKIKNLSLFNNFKRKSPNSTFNTSFKHRNRLTINYQSPILQKSPLCSTPFKDKYRGKSIYNFSPISTKEGESPNYVTITEEDNESSNSIVFLCKVPKVSKEQISLLTPSSFKDNTGDKSNKSLIYDEIHHIPDVCETENIGNDIELNTNSELVSEPSVFQITHAEPFLGFSGGVTESAVKDQNYLLKYIQENKSYNEITDQSENVEKKPDLYEKDKSDTDKFNTTLLEKYEDLNKCEEYNINTIKNLSEDVNIQRSEIYESDKERSLDKPIGESYLNENKKDESDKDSSLRNNAEMEEDHSPHKDISIQSCNSSIFTNDTPSSNSYNSSLDSEAADNESLYDTCNSEQRSLEEENENLEPKVTIERINDSVFIKYYEKMLINKEDSSSSDSNWSNDAENDVDENLSDTDYDGDRRNKSTDDVTNVSFDDCSQSITPKTTESESVGNQQNKITIIDSSTTEDNESNEEAIEEHVSFVTTRRRNEIKNDSLLIFNNSCCSISSDCDKTVLSNRTSLSYCDKSDSEIDIGVKELDINKINISKEKNIHECTDNMDRISTRKSCKLLGQRKVSKVMDSSIHEVTIIGSGEIDDGTREIDDKTDKVMKEELFKMTKNPECSRSFVTTRKSTRQESIIPERSSSIDSEIKPSIVLQPGKKWERSLSIYRRMTTMADHFDNTILEDASQKGRKYRQSVISTMEMQDSLHNESINSRRSTFVSKPSRSTIRFVKDSSNSRISLNTTEVFDDLKGFLNEECDDTVIELSELSLADSEFEVTVLDNFNDTSERIATARDYVLRRCNQTEPILFDECYPETVLKNCHKIGEGVYGEVFLWRGRDGRARVMKIVPIAGAVKVNGETQKDFHEVISEIVIAMELSALRAPIAEINRYFDEGKDEELLDLHSVENGTDVFNEVLAVRCVQGPYPSRLLDLWELYDECKGSENDNPASLPPDQQYIVLELANAGQDLESYQFTGAQQAHALFQQIAFGLAVGEESFQFEHRDLHWGNVLIAPTEQKFATFVIGGRAIRVPRGGVSATIIDYSLSRVTLPLAADKAALYNDLATDDQLFEAVGDYQFQVYRLMRDKLGNDWKNFEPYTNILWLHYTIDKMITALRYKRTNTKIHKHYIEKLKGIKERILAYKSATEYVLADIEI